MKTETFFHKREILLSDNFNRTDKTQFLQTAHMEVIVNWTSNTVLGLLYTYNAITSNLNQHALENFFGSLRSCQNSSSLIAMHFRAAYGTTFLKNLSSAHLIKSNCEADKSKPVITNLRNFILNYSVVDKDNENDEDPMLLAQYARKRQK
ncbi:hypothetical protein Bhyg_01036 [Pseudolycoriella hygida]|uniref:Uncharacterized protein n=1 Tax=Pseudolycoriella hygida TaxID=35572 RepID=A0A9Q0N8P0_9DIPT|nr:hypothetical protein Bhyg_01036 [Pseudolycoriella hygida]